MQSRIILIGITFFLLTNSLIAQKQNYKCLPISDKVSICGIGEDKVYKRFQSIHRLKLEFYYTYRFFRTKNSKVHGSAYFSWNSYNLARDIVGKNKADRDSLILDALVEEASNQNRENYRGCRYLNYDWYNHKYPYLDVVCYEKTKEEKINKYGDVVDTFDGYTASLSRYIFVDSVIYDLECLTKIPRRSKKAAKRAIWRDFRRLVRSVCIREEQESKVIDTK